MDAHDPVPALEIRLQRVANRKRPIFRVVVVPAGEKGGRFLEQLGQYDPVKQPGDCHVDTGRLEYWLSVGAKPVGDANAMIARLHDRLEHAS
ncbi:MAG: 30S ribosomal protein S16 [Myxococcales bacterium]|nr:30S ribosomal protein S16 [Myxococcales bacterium]